MLTPSTSVIRPIQLVFFLSTLLLLVSLAASFYSIRKLIDNSERVNHTNQVLIEAENIISHMKDAETGQRGYLVTHDPQFLQPYTGSYRQVTDSYARLRDLTIDNPTQQENLVQAKALYEAKFAQIRRNIDLNNQDRAFGRDTVLRNAEMLRGKKVMDDLRVVVNRIKTEEANLLKSRLAQQQFYIVYTPWLLVITALISVLITLFAYGRIKKDLDDRLAQQQDAEDKYLDTTRRITRIEAITGAIAGGDYTARSPDVQDDELGRIAKALNQMAEALGTTFTDLNDRNWQQTGTGKLNDAVRGEKDLPTLGTRLIETIAEYLNAPLGTIYLSDTDAHFKLAGRYAVHNVPPIVSRGEGLLGQVIARQKTRVVLDIPADYSRLTSSLGDTRPTALLMAPLVYEGRCLGVLEVGLLRTPDPKEIEFIERNLEPIAGSVNAALDFVRLQNFLEETQAQAEELQAQHAEMENLNAELEMQAQRLQASEEELRVQQEELQQTNTELEERGLLLEEQNDEIRKKADELEQATRYKSEFLANMSHELRTPLNSILLLSRLLAENTEENLNSDQVEYATVIQASGNGLLALIDEILDLSKIEAGQMTLDVQTVSLTTITDELQALFGIVAKEKGLDFTVTLDPEVPPAIETDALRLGQILKNLLSNAFKFTATGRIALTIKRRSAEAPAAGSPAAGADTLSFMVSDTGIGISPEKQPLIFEAFQQADGSTRRKYGGTGLGLSISRELARLLGGEITLQSQLNQGSTFTVQLPLTGGPAITGQPTPATQSAGSSWFSPAEPARPQPANPHRLPAPEAPDRYLSPTIPETVPDDRETVTAQDKVILIIEDDTSFAKALLDYARKKGYKGLVAVRGDDGLQLAAAYKPLGILLDIQLPVMSGWEVMDALKGNPQTRPIPVHIMSSHKVKNESRLKGAIDFVDKPLAFEQMQDIFRKIETVLSRDPKKVLIIEDNPKHAKALAYFLETFNINSELKTDIAEGVDALKNNEADCVILDMGVPDSKAYETLEEARRNPGLENLPIIVFTGKSLSMAEELKIRKYADSIVVKTAHSYRRMLEEVSLFLHLVDENRQAPAGTGVSKKLGGLTQILTGKTVLVADDDVRNIFSISKALEQYHMTVVAALDGQEALQKLADSPGVDVVLLDMMMPHLDGYETARKIRENPLWKHLPIIAVTAKAMTGDRERCMEAGASDYITKPVDIDQLISLLRVWLYDRS